MRSQILWAPQIPSDKGGLQRRIPSHITELSYPFGNLNLLLGYAIGIIAIAMLAHTFFPEIF
jgi:hypothetical protein